MSKSSLTATRCIGSRIKRARALEEIQRYFENAWKQIENEVYSAKDVSWITETDEQAVCLYTYEWKGFYQGEPVSGAGRATNVFIKDESGNWKLKHEHLSSLPKS